MLMSNSSVPDLSPVPHNQAWPKAAPYMEALIRNSFPTPINALEIGVWFAAGSTQIWMNNLKPGSNLLLLDAWKPFASAADMEDDKWDYRGMDNLCSGAFLSAFHAVQKFEVEKRARDVKIQIARADSEVFLPLLKNEAFDFIYIDADHKYEKVKNDIVHAKRLIKRSFGIICGDDLEKLPTPELMAEANGHKNRDYLRPPHSFHPGVLLAVGEEFEKVNQASGFWWVACQNGTFTTEILEPDSLGVQPIL
jgi:hypothetical protein